MGRVFCKFQASFRDAVFLSEENALKLKKPLLILIILLSTVFVVSTVPFFAVRFAARKDAVDGAIFVNGARFDGTFEEAINKGKGGVVSLEGTVFTKPVGDPHFSQTTVENIVIEGLGDATLKLDPLYYDDFYKNTDVLTIAGRGVTVKNLTIDGHFAVDYPLRILASSSNVLIENVTARHGWRGAVDVLTHNDATLKNVRAENSRQAGFTVQATFNSGRIVFENCSTKENLRTGVMVRNGYDGCTNLDLSGITCFENTFSVEDRMQGTIAGRPRGAVQILKPPKDSSGNPIRTDRGMFFNREKSYQHIRFGVSENDIKAADAYIDIDAERYGFESRIYFLSSKAAEKDLRAGEQAEDISSAESFFAKVGYCFAFVPRAISKFFDTLF